MPETLLRLDRLRKEHPTVVIKRDEFLTWQAVIPRQGGETFLGGRTLPDLLDRLDDLLGRPG